MNLQAACPSQNQQTCKVSCQDPTTPNQCVMLDTLLIDGSPCGPLTLFICVVPSPEANCIFTGYGGSCLNGTCQSGSILDTAKVTPCFLSQGDSRSSLTNTLFYSGLVDLVRGKLTGFHSDHSCCGPVCHHRTLGFYQ